MSVPGGAQRFSRDARDRRPLSLFLAALTIAVVASVLVLQSATAKSTSSSATKVTGIAVLLPGKKTDPGYSGLGYVALQRAAKQFGIKKTAVAESVDVAAQVEAYTSLADQGYTLVMGWGGQYEDGALKVSKKYSKTYFSDNSGTSGNGKNYASVDLAGQEWTFLVGYVMAKLSKTGKVGVVAGPCFDSTARQANGVRDGAHYANPKVKVIMTSLKSFDDPAAAKEAALAQIAEGVDQIEVNLNTGNLGVFQAAKDSKKRKVLVSTEFVDQSKQAPTVILTSSVRDSTVVISEVVRKINTGTFDGKPIRIHITAKELGLAPFHGLAPKSLYNAAKRLQAKIASGAVKVAPKGKCPLKSE